MATRRLSIDITHNNCTICREECESDLSKMVITGCNHSYHEECLTNWIERGGDNHKKCPICRSEAIPFARHSDAEPSPEDETNPYLESPLVQAVRTNNIESFIRLLKLPSILTPTQSTSQVPQPLDAKTRTARALGFSILHKDPVLDHSVSLISMAARYGYKEMVLRMLDAGANIDAPDAKGGTALIHAVYEKHVNLATALIGLGADVHARDASGNTAASFAVALDNNDVLTLLIENGVDVHTIDKEGYGLMHRAAAFGKPQVISLLKSRGIDINVRVKDLGSLTPLHISSQHNNLETASKLLALGADPNLATSINWLTPLHNAVEKDHVEMCTLLLDKGANINARSKNGSTPLIIAVQEGNIELVRLLLAHGADKTLKMSRSFNYGLYPYFSAADLAVEVGNIEIYNLLTQ